MSIAHAHVDLSRGKVGGCYDLPRFWCKHRPPSYDLSRFGVPLGGVACGAARGLQRGSREPLWSLPGASTKPPENRSGASRERLRSLSGTARERRWNLSGASTKRLWSLRRGSKDAFWRRQTGSNGCLWRFQRGSNNALWRLQNSSLEAFSAGPPTPGHPKAAYAATLRGPPAMSQKDLSQNGYGQ